MRWKAVQFGTKRVIRRFLFWPLRIDQEMRWMEWVRIEQMYCVCDHRDDELGWINQRFVD